VADVPSGLSLTPPQETKKKLDLTLPRNVIILMMLRKVEK
jgi:hypothetical protein